MIAEALHDNRGKIDLQTVHAKVNTYVKKKEPGNGGNGERGGMRALQIETEKKMLHQKELLLQQRSRGRQRSDVPVAAGQALLESIATVFAPGMLDIATGIESMVTYDERAKYTECHVTVNETDIESDEDQLQMKL
jgi:hypothetical protein